MKIRKSKFFQLPLIKKPLLWLYNLLWLICAKTMSDKTYIKFKYYLNFHQKLDLNHPQLFQEKLQWIKLNDHKPIYHQMVDKVDAKQFIAERVGIEYTIPTLGVYNSFDEIDFDGLPNQFILKGTFDSGSYYICRDKSKLDIQQAKKQVTRSWNQDYFIWSREWPYKGLKHRIIIEPLLSDGNDFIEDCKFFCFNGEPKLVYLSHDISKNARTDFFDMEWNRVPLRMRDPNSEVTPEKPAQFDLMKNIAIKLAKDTYHLRVDFYIVGHSIYVGEMTFFHCGGFQPIYPDEYNRILGDWIKLPYDEIK